MTQSTQTMPEEIYAGYYKYGGENDYAQAKEYVRRLKETPDFVGRDYIAKDIYEATLEQVNSDRIRIEALTRKAERLEKALEFYADEEKYMKLLSGMSFSDVEIDGGKVARQALADSEAQDV